MRNRLYLLGIALLVAAPSYAIGESQSQYGPLTETTERSTHEYVLSARSTPGVDRQYVRARIATSDEFHVELEKVLAGSAVFPFGLNYGSSFSLNTNSVNTIQSNEELNIGVLEDPGQGSSTVTLAGVNINLKVRVTGTLSYIYEHFLDPSLGLTRDQPIDSIAAYSEPKNNGTFSKTMDAETIRKAIISGSYKDDDGTVIFGMAESAGLQTIVATGATRAARMTDISDGTENLDFVSIGMKWDSFGTGIIAMVRTLAMELGLHHVPSPDPSDEPEYSTEEFPLLIIAGGEHTEGGQGRSNFGAVELVSNDGIFIIKGRPISQHVLVVGAVEVLNGTILNQRNLPSIRSLRNRWVSAPYQFGGITGTANSAAYVAGVAALVKRKYPTLTPAQVGQHIIDTATDIGVEGPDSVFGMGMVNLAFALNTTPAPLVVEEAQ